MIFGCAILELQKFNAHFLCPLSYFLENLLHIWWGLRTYSEGDNLELCFSVFNVVRDERIVHLQFLEGIFFVGIEEYINNCLELDLPSSNFFDIMIQFTYHSCDLMIQECDTHLSDALRGWHIIFSETILYQSSFSTLIVSHDGHSDSNLCSIPVICIGIDRGKARSH